MKKVKITKNTSLQEVGLSVPFQAGRVMEVSNEQADALIAKACAELLDEPQPSKETKQSKPDATKKAAKSKK